jgi:hypothetical protein
MLGLTAGESAAYAPDGYVLRKGLLTQDEVAAFRDNARRQLEAEVGASGVVAKGDREGKATLLKLWTRAGDDQYGLLARDERLVALAEATVSKPVYLYSHKMAMKQPPLVPAGPGRSTGFSPASRGLRRWTCKGQT